MYMYTHVHVWLYDLKVLASTLVASGWLISCLSLIAVEHDTQTVFKDFNKVSLPSHSLPWIPSSKVFNNMAR